MPGRPGRGALASRSRGQGRGGGQGRRGVGRRRHPGEDLPRDFGCIGLVEAGAQEDVLPPEREEEAEVGRVDRASGVTAGRAEAARATEAATAARYAGMASYCSRQASSTSGQPQVVAREARACMTNETPSHRRLTLVPLSSWVPQKSASI